MDCQDTAVSIYKLRREAWFVYISWMAVYSRISFESKCHPIFENFPSIFVPSVIPISGIAMNLGILWESEMNKTGLTMEY